ncbi:MAG TPA: arrestin family protein [Candidatus Lokiarchaeia archaeon]|nr:arrestin family protein [Candidatus Lokiarchaeia archaeon]
MQIILEKTHYLPGDVVRGHVQLELEKTIKARKIEIVFDAFEHAVVVRGSGKHRHVYIEDHFITRDLKELWLPGGEQCIGPCSEQFPFEFTIPSNATPSLYTPFQFPLPQEAFAKGIKVEIKYYPYAGTINYRLKAKLDKPFAIDPKDKKLFVVLPLPVSQNQPGNQAFEVTTPSGKLYLFVKVNDNLVSPGDSIQGSVHLTRAPGLKIRGLIVSLRYVYSYTARGHTDVFKQDMDTIAFADIQDRTELDEEFKFGVPPSGPFTVPGQLVKMSWEVDVKVDVPWKIDTHLHVPITVSPRESGETRPLQDITPVKIEWNENRAGHANQGNEIIDYTGQSTGLWTQAPALDADNDDAESGLLEIDDDDITKEKQ